MKKSKPLKPGIRQAVKPAIADPAIQSTELDRILREPVNSAVTHDQLRDIIGDVKPSRPNPVNPVKVPIGIKPPKDFEGLEIDADVVRDIFTNLDSLETLPSKGRLDTLTSSFAAALSEHASETLPKLPIAEGSKGASLPLADNALQILIRGAALEMSGGAERIIWDDGINQLIVNIGAITAKSRDKRINVNIPILCDHADTNMLIPFATGGVGRNAGMVLATSERPVGDKLIARIWGDALIALAHSALLSVLTSLAASSGRDELNDNLVPRSILAQNGVLVLETKARIRFTKTAKIKAPEKNPTAAKKAKK